MWRRALTYLGDAMLDGIMVGAVVGFGEALHIALAGSAAGGVGLGGTLALLLVSMALAMVGMLVVGPVLALVLTAVATLPMLRRLRDQLAEPGPTRVRGLGRLLVGVMAAAGFAATVYAITATAQREFKGASAIGLLVAALATGAGMVILALSSGLDAVVGPRIARRRLPQRLTQGRVGLAIAVVLLAGGIAALLVVAKTASPEADLTAPATAGALGLVVVLVRGAGVATRCMGRRRVLVTAAAALVVTGGLLIIGQAPATRGLVLVDGAAAPRVLRQLWAWTDGDGDGTSAMFGGADCDDDNAAIRPTAREIVGNGVDDNCRGGDLAPTALGPRVVAQASPRPVVAGTRPRNVILISVDAMRADHLGSYGYPRATTPNIDALAARGTRFAWAVSPSPTTRRAVPALMSGRYASALHWQARADVVRVEIGKNPMLGELFAAGGYDTQAIMCCTTLFDKPHGVVAGMQTVDASAEPAFRRDKYNGQELAKRAGTFIAARTTAAKPFFMWMHFIEPHNPYVAEPGIKVFGTRAIDKYDGELAFVDKQIGVIIKALRDAGIDQQTVIVVTADHGEEFSEHGGEFHGRTVFNESMRVPLVMADPGSPARVIETPVSVVDIAPTVLGLAGLPAPAGMNGRSLAATIISGAPAPTDRVVLGELLPDYRITGDLVTAFVDGWHLVWDRTADTLQLFSLTADPLDQAPIERGPVFESLRDRMFMEIDRAYAVMPDELTRMP